MLWLSLSVALATDWPLAQGTEVDRPEVALSASGFIQLEAGMGLGPQTVTGLSEANAAWEGQTPVFNEGVSPSLVIRRARLIGRGSVPGTSSAINWFISAELGKNGLTRDAPVYLADASTTWTVAPGARLRLGRFKLPMSEESLEFQPVAAEAIAFSEPVRALLTENLVVAGKYTGPASGFRDVGAQLFDTVPLATVGGRALALSYAVMVSNGGPSPVVDPSLDLTARVKVAWATGAPTAVRREEISAWAWFQRGSRPVTVAEVTTAVGRVRAGGGAQVAVRGTRVMGEVIAARGALDLGNDLPFAGQPVSVSPRGSAIGGVVTARQMVGRWALVGRWAGLWTAPEDPSDRRTSHTITGGLRFEPTPRTQVEANWEHRTLAAPEGDADAQAIADAMADRVLLSATVVF